MRVALYARVSTTDKEQDPKTQLMHLRDACQLRGWEVYREYIDKASALDVAHLPRGGNSSPMRPSESSRLVLAFKLDRAFRSVEDMHDTLAVWETLGVSFERLREQFDTSTVLGRLLLNLMASLAESELEMIRERVRAGMERARRQGKRIGRPRVTERRGFQGRYAKVLERLNAGDVSRRRAAKELGIGYATLKRLLERDAVAVPLVEDVYLSRYDG